MSVHYIKLFTSNKWENNLSNYLGLFSMKCTTFATIMEYRVPFDVETPLEDGGNIGRQGSLA